MCTVTVLPRSCLTAPRAVADPPLLRVACNRDERLTRYAAVPPSIRTLAGRRIVMPVDPDSGGTWIAASEAGLVFALLNANPSPSLNANHGANLTTDPGASADGAVSRGGLIPSLLGAATVSGALGLVLDADVTRYRPFRLLVMDAYQLVECWVDAGRLRHRRAYLHGALLRTSSSLGDAVVEAPRRALFRQFFKGPANTVAAQDAFHDHQWAGREAVSVRMRRNDARTVSHCVVELTPSFATMTYRATWSREHARVILPLAAAPALAGVRRCS